LSNSSPRFPEREEYYIHIQILVNKAANGEKQVDKKWINKEKGGQILTSPNIGNKKR